MTLRTTELPVGAPVERDEAGQALLEAAALLEEHGWVQRTFGGPRHGFCLLGALDWVLDDRADSHSPSLMRLGEFLGIPPYRFPLADWNDRPGRTEKEVVSALRKAAE